MGETGLLNPTIRTLTFDCTGDPYDLGLFWSELLGRALAGVVRLGHDLAIAVRHDDLSVLFIGFRWCTGQHSAL